jgi:hypothetical protein
VASYQVILISILSLNTLLDKLISSNNFEEFSYACVGLHSAKYNRATQWSTLPITVEMNLRLEKGYFDLLNHQPEELTSGLSGESLMDLLESHQFLSVFKLIRRFAQVQPLDIAPIIHYILETENSRFASISSFVRAMITCKVAKSETLPLWESHFKRELESVSSRLGSISRYNNRESFLHELLTSEIDKNSMDCITKGFSANSIKKILRYIFRVLVTHMKSVNDQKHIGTYQHGLIQTLRWLCSVIETNLAIFVSEKKFCMVFSYLKKLIIFMINESSILSRIQGKMKYLNINLMSKF